MGTQGQPDIGNIVSAPITPPQLPNQAPIKPVIQPGNNATAAPNIPMSQPPNVGTGHDDFSTVTSAIQQLMTAKQSEISAGEDALKANTAIDQQAAQAISGFQTNTIDAFTKVQKAQMMPAGLGKILGIFDSDYNINFQKTAIEANQARATSTAATAAALKEQNNMLPALLGKVSDAANSVLQAQLQANELVLKKGQLDVDYARAQTERGHLLLDMNKDQREQTEFNLRGMTMAQIQNELPRAQAGKGPWAGKAGFLEERLLSEQKATADLQTAQNAAAKGNREEYNSSLSDAVSHMPLDVVQQKLADAQKSGAAFVEFPTGQKGADGKPVTMQIPFDLVQQGIVKNAALEKQTNEAVAADESERLNIGPRLTNNFNVLNAFASIDPRAPQLLRQLGAVTQNLDPKNPASIRQSALLIDNIEKQRDEMIKDKAAKMGSPEAKASILDYGKTGKFDAAGGTAVTADSLGIPAYNNTALYGRALQVLNTKLATAVAAQHIQGIAPSLDPNKQADSAQIMAQLLQRPGGREKMSSIAEEIMADPTNFADFKGGDGKATNPGVSSIIKGTIQGRAVQNILSGLAQQKGATPFWQNLYQHPELVHGDDGKMSAQKLFEQFEQQSVLSHGKINYADQFLNAMRNYASNSDNASATDPSMTLEDKALEAAVFGQSPNQMVLGDLHYQLRVMASNAHQEMQKRIQQDVSGATVKQAINNQAVLKGLNVAMLGLLSPEELFKKTGLDPNQVPSATGVTGLTAAQVAATYKDGMP